MFEQPPKWFKSSKEMVRTLKALAMPRTFPLWFSDDELEMLSESLRICLARVEAERYVRRVAKFTPAELQEMGHQLATQEDLERAHDKEGESKCG